MKKYKLSTDIYDIINYPSLSSMFYYFDNNSTTLIHDHDVINSISNWISCGNASNTLHELGKIASSQLSKCRTMIANHLHCSNNEIIFTSGATESNNIIIQGVINFYLNQKKPFAVICSSFEHPSVINVFKKFNELIHIIYIEPVLDTSSEFYGSISHIDIENAIIKSPHPVKFMSIMNANNESGAIQDLYKIGLIAKKYDIFFHSDTTQTFGKFKIIPSTLHLDSLSFSAHKFHGPKGIGGLYISDKSKCLNLCYGGEQESHFRPGTENIALITGMTVALYKTHINREIKNKYIFNLKKHIFDELNKSIKIQLVGDLYNSLPNTLLLIIDDIVSNENLAKALNDKHIFISIGSACQTGHSSHVLNSYKINVVDKIKIIRISLSEYNTLDEVDFLIKTIIFVVNNSK
jgi:cysteine desulfurase